MRISIAVNLSAGHLRVLGSRIGFKPDRETARQWCKESLYQLLEAPPETAMRTEPRPLFEALEGARQAAHEARLNGERQQE